MNERIALLREFIGYSQDKFGEILGVTRSSVCSWENGRRNISESIVKSICRENWNGDFVREEWLRTGEGEMFVTRLPEDETAALLQDMLDNDNVLYNVIYSVLDEFQHLDNKNREALLTFTQNVVDNLKRRKED